MISAAYRSTVVLVALSWGCADSVHVIQSPDGTGFHAEVHGEGEPAILMPLACWFAPYAAPALADRKLVLYDPRARGRSDFPRFPERRVGLDPDVQDIEVVRRASRLDRIVLVGWSYYAAVAAHYAAQHPDEVRALVLINPLPLRARPYWAQAEHNLMKRLDAEEVASLRDRLLASEQERPRAFCREFVGTYVRGYLHDPTRLDDQLLGDICRLENEWPTRVNGLMADIFERLGSWDWREQLSTVQVPTLVIRGESEFIPRESAEEWAATLPRARLIELPQMGHLPWIEAPEALSSAITQFLDETRDGG